MKKIGLIVGFILMLLPVFGEKVTKHMAQEVALQFLSARGLEERNVIQETLEVFKGDVVAFYVINYEPEGWALLAADDRIKPVLAYSLTGKFIFNESLISPETRYWIDSYREQIHSVIKENKLPKNRDWDKLLEANEFHTKSASSSVSPLLSVKWNQTSGWNRFCPEDEDGPGIIQPQVTHGQEDGNQAAGKEHGEDNEEIDQFFPHEFPAEGIGRHHGDCYGKHRSGHGIVNRVAVGLPQHVVPEYRLVTDQ